MTKKILSLEEIAQLDPDLETICKSFNHQIISGNYTAPKFRADYFTSFYFYSTMQKSIIETKYTLNKLVDNLLNKEFTLESFMKFAMNIGYPVSGFKEIFGQREVTEFNVEYFEQPPPNFPFVTQYWETPIKYMVKKYKNKLANTYEKL
jgi:hypothetical protein